MEDARADPSFRARPSRATFDIGSYVGVPIVLSDGTFFGTLCALDPQPRTLTAQQAELLAVLARLVATQLERDRQLTERTRAVRQQAAVAELGQRGLAAIGVAELMDEAVTLVARTLEVEYCTVLEPLPDGDALVLRAGVGWQAGLVGRATVGSGLDSQAGYTLASSEPVVVEDLRRETRFSGPPLLHDHGVVSGMSVAIQGLERPYGVLGTHTTRRRTFSVDDVHFLQAVANVLGTSIERQRAEEALRRSERELGDFFDNATVGLHWVGADGTILRANQAELDLLGYTREEYVGHHIAEFHADADVSADILDQLTRNETLCERPARLRCRDGTIKDVLIDSSVLWEDGRFGHTRCFTRDVTARKWAEETLRMSEERLQLAFEAARLVSWDWDILSGDAGWSAHVRGSAADATSARGSYESFLAMVHPEDRAAVARAVERAVERNTDYHVEFRMIRPDGSVRWNASRGRALYDAAGKPLRMAGVALDITERKEAEEMLAERARLSALGADVGVALTAGGPLQDVLQRCAEAMVRHLDAAFARVWTLDEATDVLELRASAGQYTHLDGPHSRVPVGELKIGHIARERRGHLTNAVVGDPRIGDREWARREGMVAFAGHPLVVEDRLVGVMAMFARQPLGEFTLKALASVADQIAVGIERRRVEEERAALLARAQTAEAHYRVLFEGAQDAIVVTDPEGRYLDANPSASVLLGYTREELRQMRVGSLSASPERARSKFAQFLREGTLRDEGDVRRKDGSLVPVEAWVTRVELPTGQAFLATWRDVTERRRAEEERIRLLEEVERERATLAGVMASMTDGLVVFDSAHRIRYYSPRAAAMVGADPGALVGKPVGAVFALLRPAFENPDALWAAWEQALSRLDEWPSFDQVVIGPPRRDMLVQLFPIADIGGGGTGVGLVRRDVTAERDLERAKDEMISVVSHELRTPLSSVMGFAELLLTRDFAEPERRRYLGVMVEEGRRLTTLLDDFLSLERLESGRQPMAPAPIELRSLLAQVQAAAGEDPKCPIVLDVPGDLPPILADRARILQVVANLLSNARKYSPRGGEVFLAARRRGAAVEVSVRDRGLGIPAEALPRLFEKFYRVDNSDRRSIAGTGLGLAICRQIVEAHRGRIWAESGGSGQGARFCFTLPVAGVGTVARVMPTE